jgi:hypothetical protein
VESVSVFSGGDSFKDGSLIEAFWERELNKNPVNL